MTIKEAIDLINNYYELPYACQFYCVEGTEIHDVYIDSDKLELKLEPKHIREDGTVEQSFWSLNDYPLYDLHLTKEEAIEQLCRECESILTRYRKND